MRRFVFIILFVVLGAAINPARGEDFGAGLSAFNAGDYATAFANWWPLAQRGDAKAQASLGFLYYSGKGVGRDDRQSLLWFNRAADAGQPTAQFFLGLQYFYGRGVPRDLAQAYSWCDIALSNGYTESLFCRDAIALEMSAEELRRVRRRSRPSSSAPTSSATNDAPARLRRREHVAVRWASPAFGLAQCPHRPGDQPRSRVSSLENPAKVTHCRHSKVR